MKFSGKMLLIVIVKVTKIQGFTVYVEDTFFRETTRDGGVAGWRGST